MRLIDADELRKKLDKLYPVFYGNLFDGMPTIDAVQVVRCKECKHRPQTFTYFSVISEIEKERVCGADNDEDRVCPFLCEDNYYSQIPEDNFFCSYGERKEEQ